MLVFPKMQFAAIANHPQIVTLNLFQGPSIRLALDLLHDGP
jgi:hypothetical protein